MGLGMIWVTKNAPLVKNQEIDSNTHFKDVFFVSIKQDIHTNNCKVDECCWFWR